MPDPQDDDLQRCPTKFTSGNVLIYLAPLVCYWWFGPLWKVGAFITIGIGVGRSPGFLRRAFGIAFLLLVLIWGRHAATTEQQLPGSTLLMIWWFWSFGTQWHADGAKAEEDAQRPKRGWE